MVSNINLTLFHYNPENKKKLFPARAATRQTLDSAFLAPEKNSNVFLIMSVHSQHLNFCSIALYIPLPVSLILWQSLWIYFYFGNTENTVWLAIFLSGNRKKVDILKDDSYIAAEFHFLLSKGDCRLFIQGQDFG